jgi:iron-sulfur cluster repair protein YtfE (RIC family)
MSRTPADMRRVVLLQHARLREGLAAVQRLAASGRAGHDVEVALAAAIDAARVAFELHNRTEEALLQPLLAASTGAAAARIERMLEEHQAEHALLLEALRAPDAELLTRFDDLVEEVLAHMDAEERTFLHPNSLGLLAAEK